MVSVRCHASSWPICVTFVTQTNRQTFAGWWTKIKCLAWLAVDRATRNERRSKLGRIDGNSCVETHKIFRESRLMSSRLWAAYRSCTSNTGPWLDHAWLRRGIHGDAWVETHGKFCASRRMSFCLCARVLNDARCGLRDPPLITQDIWSSFTTQRMSVYLFEWRMSRKSASSMRDTEPTPWHLERKMQNIAHAQRL